MKAVIVGLRCECGAPFAEEIPGQGASYLVCLAADCPNREKRFELPTVTLKELPDDDHRSAND